MSSKRRQRRKSCEGKRAFATQAAAIAAAQRYRDDFAGALVNTYHCDHCGGYHYGHVPQRVARIIRERRGEA